MTTFSVPLGMGAVREKRRYDLGEIDGLTADHDGSL